MDQELAHTLRILIILVVIALTGFDIISSNPDIWWIYGILVVIVLGIVFLQEWRRRKDTGQVLNH